MRQTSLFKVPELKHGGELARGKRKNRRPLCPKRPLHLVLKARSSNLYNNSSWIEKDARRLALKFHLTVYSLAVNFDHIHFALRIPGRRQYAAFLRSFTGLLARKLGAGLWKLLPFTRVLAWGKDFRQVLAYLRKNREEAAGERPYEKRIDRDARSKKIAVKRRAQAP